MRASAQAVWHKFSEPLEGRVYHMYLDVKGLVTTGVGNLIDTPQAAAALPWKRPSGDPATRDEIVSAWQLVKSRQDLAPRGGNHAEFHKLTALRLSPDDVDAMVRKHLASDEAHLRKRVPDYDDLPADAQLMLHSWAWAVGPAANYPRMFDALLAGDFIAAAGQCTINPQKGTIVERNRRNILLLWNAATVVQDKLDPDTVYWPRDLVEERRQAIKEAPTLPEVENPVSEDDGGASRRQATLDTVEHPFDEKE
jgi:hypothetical protein